MGTKPSLFLSLLLVACSESSGFNGDSGHAGDRDVIAPGDTTSAEKSLNVTSTGAVGDCTKDSTSAFQAAVAAVVRLGGGTVYVPPGCYLINAVPTGIVLDSNVSLRLDSGAILKTIPNSSPNYSLITVWNKSNVNISGGTLMGDRDHHTGSSGEWGFGIDIRGSSHVVVENVVSRDFWGDGFYVGSSAANGASQNITLRSCVGENNRRQGLSMTGVNGALIDGCTFSDTAGTAPEAGIDLEPDTGDTLENVRITGCYFRNNTYGLLLAGGAGPVEQNQIIGNVMTNNKQTGVTLVSANSNLFSNNIIEENGTVGLLIYKSSNNMFSANYVSSNSTTNNNDLYSNVVVTTGSTYNNIQGNTCRKGSGKNLPAFGIQIQSVAGFSCTGNLVTGNDLYQSGATMSLYDPLKEAIVLGGNRL